MSDGPSKPTVPTPSVPSPSLPDEDDSDDETGGPDEDDIDGDLLATWWRSVALANVALGGVSVGLALGLIRGSWTVGAVAIGVGLLALVRLRDQYRAFEQEHVEDEPNA